MQQKQRLHRLTTLGKEFATTLLPPLLTSAPPLLRRQAIEASQGGWRGTQPEKDSEISTETSHWFEEYGKYFQNIEMENRQGNDLGKEGIQFIELKGYNKRESFFKKTVEKSDWESTVFRVAIGHFELNIQILRVDLPAAAFPKIHIASGKFGKVSTLLYHFKRYAAKLINHSKAHKEARDKAIKEVAFAKIASALAIGPTFYKLFGYDAILFNDGLEYYMEECSHAEEKFLNQKYCISLKADLKLLHSLKICHGDIKPANILWSEEKNKLVFIDFGMSEYVSEPVGNLTYTRFFGTHSYASPEMQSLFLSGKGGMVDLFYNDVHALWRSIRQSCPSCTSTNSSASNDSSDESFDMIEETDEPDEYEAGDIFLIKYLLFNELVDQVQPIIFSRDQEFRLVVSLKKILSDKCSDLALSNSLQEATSDQVVKMREIYRLYQERVSSWRKKRVDGLDKMLQTSLCNLRTNN